LNKSNGDQLKRCLLCGKNRPHEQFYKTKAGLSAYCKSCSSAKSRAWHLNNPERVRARKRRYYRANKERYLARTQAWVSKHPERAREHNNKAVREYRKRHPERAKAQRAVSIAISTGKLVRQPCVVCGTTENIWALIKNWSKPLEVVWLCRSHHRDVRAGRLTLEELSYE